MHCMAWRQWHLFPTCWYEQQHISLPQTAPQQLGIPWSLTLLYPSPTTMLFTYPPDFPAFEDAVTLSGIFSFHPSLLPTSLTPLNVTPPSSTTHLGTTSPWARSLSLNSHSALGVSLSPGSDHSLGLSSTRWWALEVLYPMSSTINVG